MPSPGKILGLRAPGGPWVRDDSGVYEGYTVPRFYDTLMAKLIVWAPDREAAIARMDRALAEYHVSGVRTTLPVLRRIIRHPDFAAGRLDTGFMERLPGGHGSGSRRTVALITAVLEAYERAGRQSPPTAAQGPGPWARAGRPGASGWRRR
jgi:acetyl-CoA carboxylase biotin carboxylase subunit